MTDWLLPLGGPGSPDEWCFHTVPTAEIRVHLSRDAYHNRLAALISQTQDGDEIFLIGWAFSLEMLFSQAVKGFPQLETYLEAARGRGARVRLLAIPQNSGADQVAAAKKVKVEAFLDDHFPIGSTHHQKAAFVKLKSNSHLFVGGMDVRLGRTGWFDAQAEIIGVGAALGVKTLEERWESINPPLGGLSATQRVLSTGTGDAHRVQFVRTYPPFPEDTTKWKRSYAKKGDHTYYTLLSRAIASATKSIYVEDEFFQTMAPYPTRNNATGGSSPRQRSDVPDAPDAVERLLRDAIGRGVKLVVVAAHKDGSLRPPHPAMRDALVKTLASATNPAVLLQTVPVVDKYYEEGVLMATYYENFVHTKTWIFDDEFVLIGSANLRPNSLVSVTMPADSEFGVAFTSKVDGTSLGFPKATFARALRIKMWERLRRYRAPNYAFPRDVSTSFEDETAELQKPIAGINPFEPM